MGALISKPGLTSASALAIPKNWSASWFRSLISNQLQGADVRNAVGSGGITVSGNISSPYATIAYAPKALIWSNLSLHANVSNYSPGVWQTAQYTITPEGRVIVRGFIAGSGLTSGSTVATLPAGYTPTYANMFSLAGYTGSAIVSVPLEVTAAGILQLSGGLAGNPTTWLSLSGIEFYLN